MKIEVFCDGSATIATMPGGYGFVLVIDGVIHSEGNGHIPTATNNDAELAAAIHGLIAAFKHMKSEPEDTNFEVVLCSDSQTILGWANSSYRCKQDSKKIRVNLLQELMRRTNASTQWIQGHSGHVHNERCDELANLGRLGLEATDILPKKRSPRTERTIKTKKTEILIEHNGVGYLVNFSLLTVRPA